ncbi:MAG: hypothetical protein MI674_01945, partial [Cytophagales bacterium]|nr:hypothetical protein [Cytophagales bacterium]
MKRLRILLLLVLTVSCTKRNLEQPYLDLENNVSVRGRSSLVALQKRMAQEDITSTEALVDSLNNAPPEDQEVLQQWIQAYIKWFNREPIGNLTLQQGAAIHEYSLLARIRPDNPKRKQLLRDYFNSLCSKIDEEYQQGEEPLIEALEYTLQNLVEYTLQTIDSDVFDRNPVPLIQLGNKLLAKLDPDSNAFTKANYPTHRSTLYALHQALVLIKLIDPG